MVATKSTLAFCASLICLLEVHSLMEYGSLRQPLAYDRNKRRDVLLAHADDLENSATLGNDGDSQLVHRRRGRVGIDETLAAQDENGFERVSHTDQGFPGQDIHTTKLATRVKMWPPWPISLLSKKSVDEEEEGAVTAANTYPSAAALFWAFFRQRARISARQLQEIGGQLWFHLPPAAPPLIILASFPRTIITENKEAGISLSKRVFPLASIPFARNLALSGLGLAVMSWAHMELHRKRKLTPLPLSIPYGSVSRVFLPPFLPAEVPEPGLEALVEEEKSAKSDNNTTVIESGEGSIMSLVGPKIRDRFSYLYESAPRPGIIREWKRVRANRKREAAKVRRLSVFDELVALQAIKRKSERLRRASSGESNQNTEPPGYALVTGASQGIGRAIAVELARWEIPLVLVARDIDRLVSLAYDLEACYGVKCCILSADLSERDAAERIHDTTRSAGLTVDILVNNAGIADDGLSVDMKTEDLERMMIVNTMSFAKLSKLYGQDMKRRRRGRILMVSSMSGLTVSSANCALYGATKAFGKSLALSMAKELEPHGVGVTCLLPGPVRDTQFRDRSGTGRALCWSIPFYPKSPAVVAHLGVIGVLDGDVQVIPGWQNRAFAKVFSPILPQRVETMCVQAAWSPLRLPRFGFGSKENEEQKEESADEWEEPQQTDQTSEAYVPLDLNPRYSFQQPPRLLKLPEPEPTQPLVVEVLGELQTEEENIPVESDDSQTTMDAPPVSSTTEQQDPRTEQLRTETPPPTMPIESATEQRPESESNLASEDVHLDIEPSLPAERNLAPEATTASGPSDNQAREHIAESGNLSSAMERDEDAGKDKQREANETSDDTSVGATINRKELNFSMGARAYGDDDDGDDNCLSPRLGPVDLFQNRKYVLPRANLKLPRDRGQIEV